jgi:hypothetical protein
MVLTKLTNPFSLERGSINQLFGGIAKSHTRALAGTESSSSVGGMKATHSLDRLVPQEASGHSTVQITSAHWHLRRRDAQPLREAIPLWFAITSPLIGLIIGFLGAWIVTSLTS